MGTQRDGGITWTQVTWNPVRGCSMVSAGCEQCYAMKQAHRFSGPGQPYEGLTEMGPHGVRWTGKVRHVPEVLNQPLKIKKPQRIFVNSMSDLFHEDVSDLFIADVFATMALSPRHTYQILTKRPERAQQLLSDKGKFGWFDGMIGAGMEMRAEHPERLETAVMTFPYPLPNVWLGVSVEDQPTADERIPLLLQTPAAVRWISAEPLLSEINIVKFMGGSTYECACGYHDTEFQLIGTGKAALCMKCGKHAVQRPAVNWVVVGGESGPQARPMNPAWVRSLRDQCLGAHVPFFFKQWGEWAPVSGSQKYEPPRGYPIRCSEKLQYRIPDGHVYTAHAFEALNPDAIVLRIGKHQAGHLLDGNVYQEFPVPRLTLPSWEQDGLGWYNKQPGGNDHEH